MYEVAKELTSPRHCAVIRLDDRNGDEWLLADDKAARGDENGLILMVGVADLKRNEIDRGMVNRVSGHSLTLLRKNRTTTVIHVQEKHNHSTLD
jgi:hypothetical protein